jgi:hypothetical protein
MSRGWDDERTPEPEERPAVGRASGAGEEPVVRRPGHPDRTGGTHSLPHERGHDYRAVIWRDRAIELSVSARDTLRTIGTFRTVAVADLARAQYGGEPARLARDLRPLFRQGWIVRHTSPGRRGGRAPAVLTLTRDGADVTRRYLAPPDQTIHWGLVKPREQEHDVALYRMAQAESRRIERAGGTVRRVVLDAELKGAVAAQRNAPDAPPDPEPIARTLHLRVVEGTLQIPDLRLEYETREGTIARVDLELATEHYKPSQVAAKAQAGFTIYAPASQTGRLSAALEERGIVAEILSL